MLQLSGFEDILSSVLDRQEDRARQPATRGRPSIKLAGRPRDELAAQVTPTPNGTKTGRRSADDNEIRHASSINIGARSLNTYNNFILK